MSIASLCSSLNGFDSFAQRLLLASVLAIGMLLSGCEVEPIVPAAMEEDRPDFEEAGIVGPAGGTIQVTDPNSSIFNAGIVVPEGVLRTNRSIQLSENTSATFFGREGGAFVTVLPAGRVFDIPVEVSIPYQTGVNPADQAIYLYDAQTFTWQRTPTVRIDEMRGVLVTQTQRLGTFTAAMPGVGLDVGLLQIGERMGARVMLREAFAEVPLSSDTLTLTQKAEATQVREALEARPEAFHVVVEARLKVRRNFWLDEPIETARLVWSIPRVEGAGVVAEVVARDATGRVRFRTTTFPNGFDTVETLLSGEAVLLPFAHAPAEGASYYVEALYHVVDTPNWNGEGLSLWRDGVHAVNYEAAQPFDALPIAADLDGDGILNAFDGTVDLNQPPAAPANPSPANEATEQSRALTLMWEGSDPDGDALVYDVYFGTAEPLTQVATGLDATQFNPQDLLANTTYLWRVDARDPAGLRTESPIWRFSTETVVVNQPPAIPSTPIPSDGAFDQPIDVTLAWTGSDPDGDILTYDIRFGPTNTPNVVSTNLTTAMFNPGGLAFNTTYFWQIIAKDNQGGSNTGPLWSFTTQAEPVNQPPTVSLQVPADIASGDVQIELNISDPENDASDLLVFFDVNDGNGFQPARLQTTSVGTLLNNPENNVPHLIQGIPVGAHTFLWASAADFPNASSNQVRMQVSWVQEGSIQETWTSTFFSVDNTTQNTDNDFVNSIGMAFKRIPAGTFTMGDDGGDADEQPARQVTISSDFFMGVYEVTQAEWTAVMGTNPSGSNQGGTFPVENVSWEEVQTFVSALNQREGTTLYRLPTEAEWEYATRAGSQTDYYFGDNADDLGQYAWYNLNASGRTHEVGQKLPNDFGLYDTHGNVFEWVQDWYDADYYASGPATDPQGPDTGTFRSVRSGSWGSNNLFVRSSDRSNSPPSSRSILIGFRLVRDAE